jgi:hypothetical protein
MRESWWPIPPGRISRTWAPKRLAHRAKATWGTGDRATAEMSRARPSSQRRPPDAEAPRVQRAVRLSLYLVVSSCGRRSPSPSGRPGSWCVVAEISCVAQRGCDHRARCSPGNPRRKSFLAHLALPSTAGSSDAPSALLRPEYPLSSARGSEPCDSLKGASPD